MPEKISSDPHVPENSESFETAMARLYATLGVTEEDERKTLEQRDVHAPEAIALGEHRSFANIRSSLEHYLQWRMKTGGAQPEQVIRELEERTNEMRAGLVMSYYESISDAQRIITLGALKNLFEFTGSEQNQRKKGADFGIETALGKRRTIDEALGWKQPEEVYHLAVEQQSEGHHPEGPASNYGSVRFVFDYEALGKNATFTEGDSLNPAQLPNALSGKRDSISPTRNVEHRQISKEHVPLEKAMLSLGTELEERYPGTPIFLRYVEAQVGGLSGSEIFKKLTAIEVDIERAFTEARLSRVLSNRTKEEEIYERYFKRKISDPLPLLSFDATRKPIDREAYYTEIAELRMKKFLDLIESNKSFCEDKKITYKQEGDLEKIRKECFQLVRQAEL